MFIVISTVEHNSPIVKSFQILYLRLQFSGEILSPGLKSSQGLLRNFQDMHPVYRVANASHVLKTVVFH